MKPTRPVSRLMLRIAIPVLAFLTLVSWAVSSPVASSPDDDFHLASTWCGLGDREGLCESTGNTVERLIPTPLTTATCFAFDSEKSAACWDSDEAGLTRVKRANVDGLYPRLFYATMSLLAGPDIPTSVMLMRLFNAALAVGLLTAVFWALPRWMRPALVISVLATSVPLGLFVLASMNPSSWALLSAATVWISVYAATQTSSHRRLVLTGLAVIGGVMGAGARADAAVYAVFGVIVGLLLGVRSMRAQLVPLLASAVIVGVSVILYLNASQGNAVVTGLDNDTAALSGAQIVDNFLNIPLLWTGALGGWALGWIDTNMPGAVWVLSTAVFAGALFVGIRSCHVRRAVAVGLTLTAMWLVPFVLLVQSRATVGEIVQPRYLLPLMVIAVGVASLRVDATGIWRGGRMALGGTALTFAAAIALHTNIRRYTTGTDHFSFDPGGVTEWWWAGAPGPIVVWIGGTLAFAGVFALLWFTLPPKDVKEDLSGRPEANAYAGNERDASQSSASRVQPSAIPAIPPEAL